MLRIALLAGAAFIASAAPASAQRVLNSAEASACVGYFDFYSRIDAEYRSAKRRVDSMSVDRRNSSSVDRANDAIAVSNRLLTIADNWQSFLTGRCVNIRLHYPTYRDACGAPMFGQSVAENEFCKSFPSFANALRQNSNFDQGVADGAGQGHDAEPIAANPFPAAPREALAPIE